jgi:hypothetical protein
MKSPLFALLLLAACGVAPVIGADPSDDPPEVVEVAAPPIDLLLHSERSVQVAGFSADGSRLAYVTEYDSLRGALEVVDVKTAEIAAIDRHVIVGLPFAPIALSDDGEWVLYRVVPEDPGDWRWVYESPLRVARADGSSPPIALDDRALRGSYRFLPDHRHVIWARPDGTLHVFDLDHGEAVAIGSRVQASPYGNAIETFPADPAGRRFAFLERTGHSTGRLFVFELESRRLVDLDRVVLASSIRFGIDGRISYVVEDRFDLHHLEIMDFDRGNILSSPNGVSFVLADGWRHVAYRATEAERAPLMIFDFALGVERTAGAAVRYDELTFTPGGGYLVWFGEGLEALAVETGDHFEIAPEVLTSLADLGFVRFSPDGRWLSYLNGGCQEGQSTAAHLFDLEERTERVIQSGGCVPGYFLPEGGGFVLRAVNGDLVLSKPGSDDEVLGRNAGQEAYESPGGDKAVQPVEVDWARDQGRLRAWNWATNTTRDLATGTGRAQVAALSDRHAAIVLPRGQTAELRLVSLP